MFLILLSLTKYLIRSDSLTFNLLIKLKTKKLTKLLKSHS
jgi:hypothetical protein